MGKNRITSYFILLMLITGIFGSVQSCGLCLISSEDLSLASSGCICSDCPCPYSCVEDHEHYFDSQPDTAVISNNSSVFSSLLPVSGIYVYTAERDCSKKNEILSDAGLSIAVHIPSTVLTA